MEASLSTVDFLLKQRAVKSRKEPRDFIALVRTVKVTETTTQSAEQ
jgi:hypothetical protein